MKECGICCKQLKSYIKIDYWYDLCEACTKEHLPEVYEKLTNPNKNKREEPREDKYDLPW